MKMMPDDAPDEHGTAAFLQRLGERVREARARRGMTRRILARDSGVSERYLAQLESGQGNISIALLRALARALDLPLETIVRERPETSVELASLSAYLERLPPEALADVHRSIVARFTNGSEDLRRGRLALIGLRGAGKSTLGALLAQRRGVPFVELDREIEAASGMTLSEIFDLYGQAGFRRMERLALERTLATHPRFVLATGGSLVSQPDTFAELLLGCFTIWIRAEPADHMGRVIAQGDLRPMADNAEAMADLERILAGRESLYRKADAIVETSHREVDEALAELDRAAPALAALK